MILLRINLLLMVLALLISSSAQAEWYQVEVIVFEHVNPGFDNEDWFKEPGLVQLNDTVRPVDPSQLVPNIPESYTPELATPPPLVAYEIMPVSSYKLQGVYQSLRQSRQYRPLFHIAWQQPAVDGNRSRALHLQQEDSGSLIELTIPPFLVTDPMPAEFYEPVKLLLDGTVRIRSSSFLHVDVDMVLFRPPVNNITPMNLPSQPPAESEARPVEYVRLTENNRRIKLGELHYFDHPRLGVILQVNRLELSVPATSAVEKTANGSVPDVQLKR